MEIHYKNGDFVRLEDENGKWIVIWKRINDSLEIERHASYDLDTKGISMYGNIWGDVSDIEYDEVATEDEKQTFLNALFEEGFVWDAENKIIKRR